METANQMFILGWWLMIISAGVGLYFIYLVILTIYLHFKERRLKK